MTDKEIRRLAQEYVNANWISESEAYYEGKRQIGIDDILPIFMWISQRYCIVPKVDVLNQHAWYMQRMKEVSSSRQENRGKAIALENLFGKDMFKEEKI